MARARRTGCRGRRARRSRRARRGSACARRSAAAAPRRPLDVPDPVEIAHPKVTVTVRVAPAGNVDGAHCGRDAIAHATSASKSQTFRVRHDARRHDDPLRHALRLRRPEVDDGERVPFGRTGAPEPHSASAARRGVACSIVCGTLSNADSTAAARVDAVSTSVSRGVPLRPAAAGERDDRKQAAARISSLGSRGGCPKRQDPTFRSRRWRRSSSPRCPRAAAGGTSRSGTASAACSRTTTASSRSGRATDARYCATSPSCGRSASCCRRARRSTARS